MLETSILILHYNKNYEIELILESFLQQTVEPSSFELIIIDDGSDTSISNIIDKYKSLGLSISFIQMQHNGNRAKNRQLAVSLAKGENIIFLDADMLPSKSFIEKHINNLSKGEKTVSLGYRNLLYNFHHNLVTVDTIKENFQLIEDMPCELDERLEMIYAHNKLGVETTKAWYMVYSHNLALKKSFYQQIDGFDENFRFGWGVEDVELGFQLYKKGAVFLFDENILVYHISHEHSPHMLEQYYKNLNYFYLKYKCYEPELFMLQHILPVLWSTELYANITKGYHLISIDNEIVKSFKKTLFVGFTKTNKSINDNENILISTDDPFAEYKLIGAYLPYNSKSFDTVILSYNYKYFHTDYLFFIIMELRRVSNTIKIFSPSGLISLDSFWNSITGYTFQEFLNLKRIKMVITPTSENRINNVLFIELLKALNKNGYYVSLDLTFDRIKDKNNIYPFKDSDNTKLRKFYQRCLNLYSEDTPYILDYSLAENTKGCTNTIWWGDIPYYQQNKEIFFFRKKDFRRVITRDKSNLLNLIPGIDSEKINKEISHTKKDGIVIIDLILEHIELMKKIIVEITSSKEKISSIPMTIVTLNPLLEEFKIHADTDLLVPQRMTKKQKNWIYQLQKTYSSRLNELIELIQNKQNIYLKHTDGNLEEIDNIIFNKNFYIDVSSKREFNPYVLEAAAYGLTVFTVSDLYQHYNCQCRREIS